MTVEMGHRDGGFSTTYMKCKKHPRYTGNRKPRVLCDACWWLYFEADNLRGSGAEEKVVTTSRWECDPPM